MQRWRARRSRRRRRSHHGAACCVAPCRCQAVVLAYAGWADRQVLLQLRVSQPAKPAAGAVSEAPEAAAGARCAVGKKGNARLLVWVGCCKAPRRTAVSCCRLVGAGGERGGGCAQQLGREEEAKKLVHHWRRRRRRQGGRHPPTPLNWYAAWAVGQHASAMEVAMARSGSGRVAGWSPSVLDSSLRCRE